MLDKKIALLGSTGSIGTQSLEVCQKHNIRVTALSAHKNVKLMEEQARKFKPLTVCMTDESAYKSLKQSLSDTDIEIVYGVDSLCEIAASDKSDTVLNSVVGIAGLKPTMACLEASKTLALANKESLVTGGKLVTDTAKKFGAEILPVDSEHSAIFQCLEGRDKSALESIILTASGGPFFGKKEDELKNVTVEQALKHPNWSMGAKITIDSATLMNKGLELIEAVWLFDRPASDIQIVVHRESVVHSAIELKDGSVIAQLGVPDMKIPIQLALTYPKRLECDVKRLKLSEYGKLTFFDADEETFKCLAACRKAIGKGGLYPCIANGANEKAVELFLDRKIGFTDIGELVMGSVELKHDKPSYTLDEVFEADALAREFVMSKAGKI